MLVLRNQEFFSPENCFEGFEKLLDGTPGVASAEGDCQIRMTRDSQIIDSLVCFQLQNKTIKGEKHAHNLISSIKSKNDGPNTNPKNWIVATQNSCIVNLVTINRIHRTTSCTPNKNFCSHTLYLGGSNYRTPTIKFD